MPVTVFVCPELLPSTHYQRRSLHPYINGTTANDKVLGMAARHGSHSCVSEISDTMGVLESRILTPVSWRIRLSPQLWQFSRLMPLPQLLGRCGVHVLDRCEIVWCGPHRQWDPPGRLWHSGYNACSSRHLPGLQQPDRLHRGTYS